MCCGCGSSGVSEEDYQKLSDQNNQLQAEVESANAEIAALNEKIDALNEELQSYEKYKEYEQLISLIDAEDYKGAIAITEQLQSQKLAEKAEAMADYTTSVSLSPDNFFDYFEFVTCPAYTPFGEIDESRVCLGLKSKMFDEGYIIYSMDDIAVNVDTGSGMGAIAYYLNGLLGFNYTDSASINLDNIKVEKISDGKVIYVNKDYVESYELIEPKQSHSDALTANILLKNGETINWISVEPDYQF